MTAKLSDWSLKLYQAFGGFYVGQLHNFQMCSLGHHWIRRQRDDVVAHLRQSFTLGKKTKKGNPRWKKAAASQQAYESLITFAPVERNSPHAEFCFPSRTRSSPARMRQRVKLVIIGLSAVGGYKLGTYNPQHSHTDVHDQTQTPNK